MVADIKYQTCDSSFFDELQQLLQGVYVADVILFII